jgi:hypothetical protein
MSKKNIIILSVIGVLLIACSLLLYEKNLQNKNDSNVSESSSESVPIDNQDIFVIVDINPRIMLKINNNIIIEIYQLNEDSYIYQNKDIQGLTLENGINTIIKTAKDNNFINENTEVKLSLYNSNNDNGSNLLDLIKSYFENNSVNAIIYNLTEQETNTVANILSDYKEQESKVSTEETTVTENTTTNDENKNVVSETPKTSNKASAKTNNNTTNNNSSTNNTPVTTDKEITVEEEIPYTTQKNDEVNMLLGTTKTIQQGVNGKKNVIYKVIYDSNNQEISRNKLSETIVTEPITELIKVGTSEYNINTDTFDIYDGWYCEESQIIYVSQFDDYECDQKSAPSYLVFNGITSDRTQKSYAIPDNSNVVLNVYPANYKNSRIYKVTYQSKTIFLEPTEGSGPNPLTEAICNTYKLTCGEW